MSSSLREPRSESIIEFAKRFTPGGEKILYIQMSRKDLGRPVPPEIEEKATEIRREYGNYLREFERQRQRKLGEGNIFKSMPLSYHNSKYSILHGGLTERHDRHISEKKEIEHREEEEKKKKVQHDKENKEKYTLSGIRARLMEKKKKEEEEEKRKKLGSPRKIGVGHSSPSLSHPHPRPRSPPHYPTISSSTTSFSKKKKEDGTLELPRLRSPMKKVSVTHHGPLSHSLRSPRKLVVSPKYSPIQPVSSEFSMRRSSPYNPRKL